jgi:PAS domain S-box-containing protein
MRTNYINRRTSIGFSLALAMLAVLAVYSYVSTKRMITSAHWVAHTHDVLHRSQRLLAVAVNLEIGQRSYTMLGDEEFLEPYNYANKVILQQYDSLKRAVDDNPRQVKRVKRLGIDIDELVSFSNAAVEARRVSFEKAYALNATGNGKRILDRIRNALAQFEKEETELLEERMADSEERIADFNMSFIGLLTAAALMIIASLLSLNQQMRKRDAAERELISASEAVRDLYDNAPCGYHSLNPEGVFVEINNTLLGWLGYEHKEDVIGKLRFTDILSEADAAKFNENYPLYREKGFVKDMEFSFRRRDGSEFPAILSSKAIFDDKGNFVKSRSNSFDITERKAAETRVLTLNKELEAFTYSVSHDLRAPLRSIDGYSRILIEDYQAKLDAEGQRLINIIVNNANRMGKLIDDLLDFSRLGRRDLQRTYIDMSSLARAVAQDVVEQEKGANVTVKVNPLHECFGDVDMIRQVWVNLISNAVKYSGRNPQATIEIGSDEDSHQVHYYVKDNGVGFDMQYAGKLFGVFQRLHRIQEFPGTGVGLAIVKRIVNRHEGRVWAEGTLDKGAIFHFSIPQNNGKA